VVKAAKATRRKGHERGTTLPEIILRYMAGRIFEGAMLINLEMCTTINADAFYLVALA